jgi:hypothetical protein
MLWHRNVQPREQNRADDSITDTLTKQLLNLLLCRRIISYLATMSHFRESIKRSAQLAERTRKRRTVITSDITYENTQPATFLSLLNVPPSPAT